MNKNYHWSDEEKSYLKQNYGQIKTTELASILNRTVASIHGKAKQLNIKADLHKLFTKFTVNESYFSIPNINNCYWAGFIAADGCVSKKNLLEINLGKKDKCILERFIEQVDYKGVVKTNKGKTFDNVRIAISCPQWISDLNNNWNITKQKTGTLKPPNLTELEHKLSYIIGYIDGDGSVYKLKKEKHICLSICGNKEILEWISKTLFLLEDIDRYKETNLYYSCNIHQIRYVAKRARNLLNKLKNIKTPYKLERKWSIIDSMV